MYSGDTDNEMKFDVKVNVDPVIESRVVGPEEKVILQWLKNNDLSNYELENVNKYGHYMESTENEELKSRVMPYLKME